MALTLDTATLAAYTAASTADARAQAVIDALSGTVYVRVYNGAGTLMGEGTMAAPWATRSGSVITVGEVATFGVLVTGTPDASGWYLRFEDGSGHWVRGPFGPGGNFTWSAPAWTAGQGGQIGTVTLNARGTIALVGAAIAQASAAGGLTVSGGGAVIPAVYPLELIQPRASGTAPGSGSDMPSNPTMPSGHRIFSAYPGMPYNIRASVMGGSYPFTFSLSDAPTGMTIDARTGEINWPNPTGTTVTPTITVTDAEGTVESSSWTITITTSGFRFADISAGSNGSGTISSPHNSLYNAVSASSVSDIIVLRSGNYTLAGFTTTSVGQAWERVELGSALSNRWIAYPGESVTINHGYVAGVTNGAMIRIQGSNTYPAYFDGIHHTEARNILLQALSEGLHYQTFRRLELSYIRNGTDGDNPGGIMTVTDNSGTNPGYWTTIQDINGHDLVGGGTLKIYARFKLLMEDVGNIDCEYGPDVAKARISRWEVRGATITGTSLMTPNAGIYGSMNLPAYTGYPQKGEIRFCKVLISGADADTFACHLNEFGVSNQIDVYRCTFVGAKVGAVQLNTYEDGPFRFYNNVIVSDESGDKITRWTGQYGGDGSAATNVIVGTAVGTGRLDNLIGVAADGIVDANGLLQGSYRASYLGTHGHEVP